MVTLSEIIDKIAKERYLRGDEKTMEDVYRRTAEFVGNAVNLDLLPSLYYRDTIANLPVPIHNEHDVEQCNKRWGEHFFDLMVNGIFLPNTPALSNAGTETPMLSACFGLPVNDSFDGPGGIDATEINSRKIFRYGGGVGYNFSGLRPKGARVKSTDGVASGPVSFMRLYDASIGAVKQGGRRRGAAIGILDVDHADIREFVVCKNKEGDFSNFNISVMVTDVFMEHVHDVASKEILDLMVDGIWNNGEPGILFYDTINRDQPNSHLYRIKTTNPCVVGDTLLLTNHGYVQIKDVVGTEVDAWNGFEWSRVKPRITGYDQELMKIEFSDGTSLTCTPYHGFKVFVGNSRNGLEFKKEAHELVVGDKLAKCGYPVMAGAKKLENAYTHGFFSGDGFYDNYHKCNAIRLYGEKTKLVDYLNSVHTREENNRTYVKLDSSINYIKEFVPDAEYTCESRLEWLAGIIDSDGTQNSADGTLSISSINKQFLVDIKLMLNTLGCNGTVSLMKKAVKKMMPDGNGGLKEYNCKDCYRLTISSTVNCDLKKLGLVTYRVNVFGNPNRNSSRFVTVKSITKLDHTETVYCANEPKNHTLIFNGVYSLNCGEVPIGVDPETGGGEACSLLSINLTKFVMSDDGNNFNWDGLREVVRDAVVFLDTTIDINKFPTPEITEMVKKTRKIFIGFMGLADAMIMMGIRYGTPAAVAFTKNIMFAMMDAAINMSTKLASLRGVFPAYEGSLWEKKGMPIRNSTLTGVAPTGTLSILAECSSGIEPHYNWVYERDNTVGEKFLVVVPIFEERLDEYIEMLEYQEAHSVLLTHFNIETMGNPYSVLKEAIIEDCFIKGTIQHMTFLPSDFRRLFVTATDIPYQQHIAIQAAAQEFCDNSISKTINMKNDATKEDVRDAIMLAWKSGCKGFTMYREGSRDDVVLKLKSGEKSIATLEMDLNMSENGESIVDGLDKNLPAIYNEVRTGCGILHVIVVAKDGKPRKLFVNCAGAGGCEANNALTGGLVSLLFKNGISRDDIVKRLKMVRCSACIKNQSKAEGKSCGDAIGNVIRDLIPENIRFVKPVVGGVDNDKMIIKVSDEVKPPVKTAQAKICPECGHPISNYEGRCFTCQNCGYAKCG